MSPKNNALKLYQIPFLNKIKIVFEYYEFGMPVVESFKDAKFEIINEFVNKMVALCGRVSNEKSEFFFQLNLEPEVVESLKNFLIQHKNFIFKYITSKENFIGSHIYQLKSIKEWLIN